MTELLKKLADEVDANEGSPDKGGDTKPPSSESATQDKAEGGGQAPGAKEKSAKPTEGPAPAAASIDPKAIIAFFAANPSPDDATFHSFAEQNGWDVHQAETVAYAIATKFINFLKGGRYNEKQLDIGSVSPDELAMGIEVEQEHTPDIEVAKKIALDHLAEFPDYYTRLKKMEEDAKAEAGAAAVPKGNLNGEAYGDGQESPGSGGTPSGAPVKDIPEDEMATKNNGPY